MDAFLVVEAIDVAGERGTELDIAAEGPLVRELGLQGMEETLHVGVVLAIARTIHARNDAAGAQECLIVVGRVFDASVGMEDEPGFGIAQRDRAFEGANGYRHGSRAGERPANDAPGEQIHHRGEVAPVLAQAQVSEIAHPDLVRARGQRLLQPQVVGLREELAQGR